MAPAYHAVGSALRAVAGRGARGRGGRGSGHVGCRRPRAGCALPDIRRRPPVAPGPLAALPGHVHGRGARVAVGGSPACERAAGRLTAKSAARRPAISHTPDPLRFPSRAVHGPHACEGYPMTLPAPRRARTFLLVSAAAAVALAGPMLAAAQQPSAGASPKPTDEVTVNYRGTLISGTEFDSSYKRGQPANFQLNRVIPGWTEALGLMKPGAKWQLFIPPQLGYDLRSAPPIPPGSLLIFEVELLSVKAAPSTAQSGAPAPPATPPATPPAEKPAAK